MHAPAAAPRPPPHRSVPRTAAHLATFARWLCLRPACAHAGLSRRQPRFLRQRRLASSTISQYSRHATPCIHQTALPHASTGLRSHGLLHLSESPTPDMAAWRGGEGSGLRVTDPPTEHHACGFRTRAVRWGEEVVAWAAKGCPRATLTRTTREPRTLLFFSYSQVFRP